MRNPFAHIFLLLAVLLVACEPKEKTAEEVLSENEQTLIEKINTFGFSLLSEVNTKTDVNTSYAFSPFNTSLMLAMLYNGAGGDTKNQIGRIGLFEDMPEEDLNFAFNSLVNHLEQADDYATMISVNAIWYSTLFGISSEMQNKMQSYYFDLRKLSPGANTGIINTWLSGVSDTRISSLKATIPTDAALYGAGALVFDSPWTTKFNNSYTSKDTFTIVTDAIYNLLTPEMIQKEPLNTYKDDDIEVVELPFGGGNFSMLLFKELRKGKDVEATIGRLNNNLWKVVTGGLAVQKNVQVYLPKFRFDNYFSMKDILPGLGLSTPFNTNADGFPFADSTGVFFNGLDHRTAFEVSESGINEASILNPDLDPLSVEGTSLNFYPYQLDGPFILIVREVRSNAIVLIGKVVWPFTQDNYREGKNREEGFKVYAY